MAKSGTRPGTSQFVGEPYPTMPTSTPGPHPAEVPPPRQSYLTTLGDLMSRTPTRGSVHAIVPHDRTIPEGDEPEPVRRQGDVSLSQLPTYDARPTTLLPYRDLAALNTIDLHSLDRQEDYQVIPGVEDHRVASRLVLIAGQHDLPLPNPFRKGEGLTLDQVKSMITRYHVQRRLQPITRVLTSLG